MKIGKPIKYLAVRPDTILDRVKKNIQEEANETTIQIQNVKETEEFKELELLHKTGVQHVDISSISKSIVGRATINRFIKEMISKAKSNVVIVTPQEHLERHVKILKMFMLNFAKKGIKVKLYTPYDKAIIKKLQNVEHVEYSPNARFVSIDKKEMVFLVSSDSVVPDYEVAIWISSPFFVNAVNILFEESLK